ncbi:uncharacterized protein LOC134687709 [Mytilus trossulus]|uniref:uncharacterized protein LOC134687709 n=1 Tax=Mytilus trossulus TaxID=6551 RepID=UPI003007105D
MDSERTFREARRLTPEGQLMFEENVRQFTSKLRIQHRYIDMIFGDIHEHTHMTKPLACTYKQELMKHFKEYEEISRKYDDYLISQRCDESSRERSSHNLIASSLQQQVSKAIDKLEAMLQTFDMEELNKIKSEQLTEIIQPPDAFREPSNTGVDRKSNCSRGSSHLSRQRAKVEVAKTRAKFAQEEVELMRKQTAIQADMKLLSVKRDIEEAECELRVLNENFDEDCAISEPNKEDVKRRTAEFILKQTDQNANMPLTQNLNVDAPTFKPAVVNQMPTATFTQTDACREFTQFIVKKDLLLSRLCKYDDTPGYFLAWKASFTNVMRELNVTPSEELDLLVKWLGPESCKQALSIRAANVGNASQGVARIWARLQDRFGSPEIVESALRKKLNNFAKIGNKDNKRLFELFDIVSEIEAVKENDMYRSIFSVYDSSAGVKIIIAKLPYNIQEKWTTEATRYKTQNHMVYPPFTVFTQFLQKIAKMKNDPSFFFEDCREAKVQNTTNTTNNCYGNTRNQISCARTETSLSKPFTDKVKSSDSVCPVHGTNHLLNECRGFRMKPISERWEFLKKNGICFRCCGPKRHLRRDCKEFLKCSVCQSREHPSALHTDIGNIRKNEPPESHEGENESGEVITACTQICGQVSGTSKSCSKLMLVKVYPKGQPEQSHMMYSLIDDQSNKSLATSNFFYLFSDNGPETEYVLSSCAGKFTTSGRLARDYVIEALDGSCAFDLPTIIECNDIPNNRQEIASPNVAIQYPHLVDIAPYIPEINEHAQIDLLIGRDLISVHHVLDQRLGKGNLPYAQKLPLGWAIIGEVCLGKSHPPGILDFVNVNKTTILSNGRATFLKPCQSDLQVGTNIFRTTDNDEKIGASIEDDTFLKIMNSGFVKNSDGCWVAPLPFREHRPILENNKQVALKRAKSFDYSLKINSTKREHVIQFMQKIIENGHAEIAPPLAISSECWYLPMFGIYHPRKPDNIRVVFDASAVCNGHSLNNVLLKGPDLTNSLLGILLRFRKEAIAVTADVEQMFYNFKVSEEHRNYLRFIWHSDNDIEKPLIDYRMTVHVFGNSPSPSVATYGLRKSAETADQDVKDFVNRNFYVADGLLSCQNVETAVDLVKRTQSALSSGGNLRLHKIASNSKHLLSQFPVDDLAKNLKDLKFENDCLPLQRSLGMAWDINNDCFTFQVAHDIKPFSKRGVLSTINSLFDPIGFTAPVSVRGKLLLRDMLTSLGHSEWDDPLPDTYLHPWKQWINTLPDLEQCCIPRMYSDISYAEASNREVHIFCDASKEAIGAVAYLRLIDSHHVTVSFLLGKAKVAPSHGNTIPRLELCASVLAAELSDLVKEHLGIDQSEMYFYSDSKIVLGYLTNESKRFHVYVGNRVRRIRVSCDPKRWSHVSTENNPADIATRGINPAELSNSLWIKGPAFLYDISLENLDNGPHQLVDADSDKEIRPEVQVAKTQTVAQNNVHRLGTHRFSKFSEWRTLVRAISLLKQRVRNRAHHNDEPEHLDAYKQPDALKQAQQFIIREVQMENYRDEIDSIKHGKSLHNNSSLSQLSPILDVDDTLRVGGRLRNYKDCSDLSKHPIILPKHHHISLLIVRHFHEKVAHQGRSLTDGAIRTAGF